ncbi:MAG: DUF4124 domain-containing protein [Proteobacteria bacterium]|nr:DUF4124 domain-containing protein [Pseudomonadota bacterium]
MRSFPLFAALSAAVLLLAPGARAEFYKYKDDSGQVHFVDDLSRVPPEYQDQVNQYGRKKQEIPARIVRSMDWGGMGKKALVKTIMKHKGAEVEAWLILEFLSEPAPGARPFGAPREERNVSPFRETLVSGSCKRLLNLERDDLRPFALEFFGKTLRGETCNIESIQVGDYVRANCPVVFVADSDPQISGILGTCLLEDVKHQVDYERQLVTLGE